MKTFKFNGLRYDSQVRLLNGVIEWVRKTHSGWKLVTDQYDLTRKGATPILKVYGDKGFTIVNVPLPPNNVSNTISASRLYASTLDAYSRLSKQSNGSMDPMVCKRTVDRMLEPTLGILQPVGTGNMECTPFGKVYSSGLVLNVIPRKTYSGTWELGPPSSLVQGSIIELCRPSDARRSISSTTPVPWFEHIPVMKRFKRLKLITGWQVKGIVPEEALHPSSTLVVCRNEEDLKKYPNGILRKGWPDGVILISKACASKFKLQAKDGSTVPLRTGDKLAGVIDTKEYGPVLVKGTAVIKSLKGYTMWLSDDAIKGRVEFNTMTQLHVQSLAAERVSIGGNLSYQLLQFFPEIAKKKALRELEREPLIGRYVNPEDGEVIEDHAPSIKSLIEGDCKLSDIIKLFEYPIFNEEGEVTGYELSNIGNDIIASGSWKGYEHEVGMKVYTKMDQIFNPPSKKVSWLVAVPNNSGHRTVNTMTVSLPESVWDALGRPTYVAVTRFPIKGPSSLVRLRVRTHTTDMCAHVSPQLMDVVWNGDFDGDQVQIIADRDLINAASDPIEAYKKAIVGRNRAVKLLMMDGTPESIEEAVKLLLDMDQMGLATTIRDNLYAAGISEEDLLAVFESIVQPAISRKEGAMVEDATEDTFLKEVGNVLGISYLKTHGNLLTRPNRALRILRNRGSLSEDLMWVNKLCGTTRGTHSDIVSVLMGLTTPWLNKRKVNN